MQFLLIKNGRGTQKKNGAVAPFFLNYSANTTRSILRGGAFGNASQSG